MKEEIGWKGKQKKIEEEIERKIRGKKLKKM